MIETWRVYPKNRSYWISNLGRVFSTKAGGKLLKTLNVKGYKVFNTYSGSRGSIKQVKVHRAVMESFNGPSKLVVNHIDGDKTNNKLTNLEYCTDKQNVEHAFATGLRMSGEKASNAKLTDKDLEDIRSLYEFRGYWNKARIAEKFGVSITQIGRALKGKRVD